MKAATSKTKSASAIRADKAGRTASGSVRRQPQNSSRRQCRGEGKETGESLRAASNAASSKEPYRTLQPEAVTESERAEIALLAKILQGEFVGLQAPLYRRWPGQKHCKPILTKQQARLFAEQIEAHLYRLPQMYALFLQRTAQQMNQAFALPEKPWAKHYQFGQKPGSKKG